MDDMWSEMFFSKLTKICGNEIIDYQIERNINLSWNFFNNHPEIMWSYQQISINPNINLDIVKKNKDKDWDYKILLYNKNIRGKDILEDDIFKNLKKFIVNNFDAVERKESWDFLQKCENQFKLNYDNISLNENITWEIVSKNINKPWNFKNLSLNKNINIDIINSNPQLDWSIKNLSLNENINITDIENNPTLDWCYQRLSSNPNITFDYVLNNLDKDWNFYFLSANPNINYDIILKYKEFDWSIDNYCKNKNLNFNDLEKMDICKKNFYDICNNDFTTERNIGSLQKFH